MSKHVSEFEDGYLLSPAATLAVIADATINDSANQIGQARARRVIEDVMVAAREAKFEQVDILDTMVSTGTSAARLLPFFDSLVKRVGAERIVNILQRAVASISKGDAA